MSGRARSRPGDRVRVAAYAIVRDDQDRVLLCHIHPSVGVGDVWTLPGGGLEFGEAPRRAALRELQEETGLIGRNPRLIGVSTRPSRMSGGIIVLGYRVEEWEGEVKPDTDAMDYGFFHRESRPLARRRFTRSEDSRCEVESSGGQQVERSGAAVGSTLSREPSAGDRQGSSAAALRSGSTDRPSALASPRRGGRARRLAGRDRPCSGAGTPRTAPADR